ncbi:MAG: hypothetical protein JO342_15575 [Solirubrobacterales bacterium]|nr:hypothetical protein [Solirubrobacterales bacterium]MBV9167556.1 hypothetical protein [Solirubrobacterales bacterium]
MTTPTVTELVRNGNHVGERRELGRYTIPEGERLIIGQRINGVVRLVDVPAGGRGRHYLIERQLEQDGHSALNAIVADYLQQAEQHRVVPMLIPIQRWLDHADTSDGRDE